jgi:hypothetical protein
MKNVNIRLTNLILLSCFPMKAWGKHTPAHYRIRHSTKLSTDIDRHSILPIVMVRNPYTWMKSMCHNPYAASWGHTTKNCPHLMIDEADEGVRQEREGSWNPVTVTYGAGVEKYKSLQHLWNDWYNEYYTVLKQFRIQKKINFDDENASSSYPLLLVRIEDIIFHTEETVTKLCNCAGGTIRTGRPFHFIINSAKANVKGHSTTTGLLDAWIEYSKPASFTLGNTDGLAQHDYNAFIKAVDKELLATFNYTI